ALARVARALGCRSAGGLRAPGPVARQPAFQRVKRRSFLAFCSATLVPAGAWGLAPGEAVRFSSLRPGGGLPAGFRHVALSSGKRETEYTLVEDGGGALLRGHRQ